MVKIGETSFLDLATENAIARTKIASVQTRLKTSGWASEVQSACRRRKQKLKMKNCQKPYYVGTYVHTDEISNQYPEEIGRHVFSSN
jgi:hypothetical protein